MDTKKKAVFGKAMAGFGRVYRLMAQTGDEIFIRITEYWLLKEALYFAFRKFLYGGQSRSAQHDGWPMQSQDKIQELGRRYPAPPP